MKRLFFISIALLLLVQQMNAQNNHSTDSQVATAQPNYKVQQALEIESLFPMFFTGGYHLGLCYRYQKFRIRASVINGGSYDATSRTEKFVARL